MALLDFFRKPQSTLSAELKRTAMRNELRFKAQRLQMEAEGKHLLQPSFKWIPADEYAARNGLL